MSVRFYGFDPYSVVVVHGGPGAPGSVAGLARGISEKYSVIEPIQSKCGINDLVEELRDQIEQHCVRPVVLIGHSWGAWLAGLTAAEYPGLVRKLILVACGPLLVRYVEEIGLRRERNMSPEAYMEYKQLLSALNDPNTADKDKKLARLGAIAGKADGFDEVADEAEEGDALPADGDMYSRIASEVMQLREGGQLLAEFQRIKCPMVLIQGEADSHPYAGVIEPLLGSAAQLKTYILEKCGHMPWKERYAKDRFYRILFEEIN